MTSQARRRASTAIGAPGGSLRLLRSGEVGGRLRIAVLAPPWIAVPPPGYGGIEAVVDLLCGALVARGHEVTLFAASGSRSPARVHALLKEPHPDTIGAALHESDHLALAWEPIELQAEQGRPFDVVQDHSGYTALALADRVNAPVVHTIHRRFDRHTARFCERHGRKATLAAITRSRADSAPPGVTLSGLVPNPIRVNDWPLGTAKGDYVLSIGRMDPVTGADRAIEAARLAGHRLILAGPVQTGQEQYFRERIQPHLDGQHIRYVGEVTAAAKQQLYANARALLMPVRWRERFEMVLVDAGVRHAGERMPAGRRGRDRDRQRERDARLRRARDGARDRSTTGDEGRSTPRAGEPASRPLRHHGHRDRLRARLPTRRCSRQQTGGARAPSPTRPRGRTDKREPMSTHPTDQHTEPPALERCTDHPTAPLRVLLEHHRDRGLTIAAIRARPREAHRPADRQATGPQPTRTTVRAGAGNASPTGRLLALAPAPSTGRSITQGAQQ